jgi:Zn-dependent protease
MVIIGFSTDLADLFHNVIILTYLKKECKFIFPMVAEVFSFVIFLTIFLFSVVFHEVSHGLMAYHLGDSTAKERGRLSLNPLKHLDPIGSILIPGFLLLLSIFSGPGIVFGWAKPVPVDFRRLRDKKYGPAKVALAGPLANLSLALVFGLVIRLSGSWLNSTVFGANLTAIFGIIVWINLLLAVFNLLPIPPLDGSHLLFALLPSKWQKYELVFQQYGLLLLLVFIFFFFDFLIPLIQLLFRLFVGSSF